MSQKQIPGPFENHLREAISLNKLRAPVYAKLDKNCIAVSRRLILYEHLLLEPARLFDNWARPYHLAGIALLEDLFIPMTLVPPFKSTLEPVTPKKNYAFSPKDLNFNLSYAKMIPHIENELAKLAIDSCFNCMLRHLLESMLRLSQLAPLHLAQSLDKGLHPPERLLRSLFCLHRSGLRLASNLDRQARPLQMQGIAIICQDLPPITPYYQ